MEATADGKDALITRRTLTRLTALMHKAHETYMEALTNVQARAARTGLLARRGRLTVPRMRSGFCGSAGSA